MMRALALALLLPATSALSEGVKFDGPMVEQCLAGGGWRDCIGQAAGQCMQATPGGESTAGMVGCLDAEWQWWDGELNSRYRELLARARQIDAEPPIEGMLPRPSDEAALRAMQRAWISWRDATCDYEALQWWGGSGASPARIGCLLGLTGEQALRLRSLLAEG
ncbi:MAG: lysozyme inhibitor LprI family protein [Pararhodobacter sp.]